MGTGHVMRCLALAQAWQDTAGDVVFVMSELTLAIVKRLRDERMEIVRLESSPASVDDANELAALAHERGATWVVVDGYHFDSAYQRSIKDSALQLLFIDDTGEHGPYCADLVLNQNAYADQAMYRHRDPATTVLLGPHYALLRREFAQWRSWQRNFAPIAKHVLITMGGSDPHNVTAQVLDATRLADMESTEITVVIGGSSTHTESLREVVSKFPGKIRLQVDVENMAEVMAGADLAISAAGCTCYELALLQVPMVLIALAENQTPTARALANNGAATDAGWFDCLDPESFSNLIRTMILDCDLRCTLAKNARRLVDGRAAHRVCQFLLRDQRAQSGTLSKLQVGAV